jgi:PKD repeat protein
MKLLIIPLLLLIIGGVLAADTYTGYIAPSLSGPAPYTVNFTDITYGTAPFTYKWNATNVTGNNIEFTMSTELNPSYTFEVAGNYSIHLVSTNAYGTNTSPISWVNVTGLTPPGATAPVSSFVVNKYTVVFPWIIVINSTSTNNPDTYAYSFNDGSANMTTANGTHQYSRRGVFPITLYVSNTAGGSQSMAYIRVVGYQGLTMPADKCVFTSSRVLDKFEYARVNCQLCGVCEVFE